MKPVLLLLGLGILLACVLWYERQDRRKRIALIDEEDRIQQQRARTARLIRDLLVPPAVREARQRFLDSVEVEVHEMGVFVKLTDPRAAAEYCSVAPAFGARKGAA